MYESGTPGGVGPSGAPVRGAWELSDLGADN